MTTGTLPPGRVGRRWASANARLAQRDLLGFLRQLQARHGDLAAFTLHGTTVVLVHEWGAVRELLMDREDRLCKPAYVKASNRGHWGDGLTTLEGVAWVERRPVVQPVFRAEGVRRRMAIVERCTDEMVERWPRGGRIDLHAELRGLTARIALRTVLDADIQGLGDAPSRSGLVPWTEAWGEDFTGRDHRGLLMRRPRAPRRMDTVVRLIDERLAGAPPRDDLLSEMLHLGRDMGRPWTRDALRGEVIQMLYAGHLTVPASLVACWHAVATHGQQPALARDADGQWALAVLKESLRLHAPAPLLYREVAQPFRWRGHGFTPGTAVWVSPALLHTDPRYHADPQAFRPGRFVDQPAPAAFLPFGIGPRTCAANHGALQQMARILHRVARTVALQPRGGADGGFHVLPLPEHGAE